MGRLPPIDFDGALTNLEAKSDVASLEGMHHERRQLYEKHSPLIARYGSFGLFDDFRKSFVERQKLKARVDLTAGGGKATEGAIDAAAYGSDAYIAFLDNALAEKVEWVRVDEEIRSLNERIRNREIAMLAYSAEVKLGR